MWLFGYQGFLEIQKNDVSTLLESSCLKPERSDTNQSSRRKVRKDLLKLPNSDMPSNAMMFTKSFSIPWSKRAQNAYCFCVETKGTTKPHETRYPKWNKRRTQSSLRGTRLSSSQIATVIPSGNKCRPRYFGWEKAVGLGVPLVSPPAQPAWPPVDQRHLACTAAADLRAADTLLEGLEPNTGMEKKTWFEAFDHQCITILWWASTDCNRQALASTFRKGRKLQTRKARKRVM